MFNFENLTPIKNVNTRVNYDLRYSAKTGRFNLSQSAFDKFDIQNNGFNLFKDGNNVIFQLAPNDEAALHSGRDGKNKGLSFTAKSVVNTLKLEDTTEFVFEDVIHDGKTFLILKEVNDSIAVEEELDDEDDAVYAETETEHEIID